ncbi:MAG: peptidase [Caulobacteraceae bacterium]|nr:peptidase [Caulobacteraceae bacterium]
MAGRRADRDIGLAASVMALCALSAAGHAQIAIEGVRGAYSLPVTTYRDIPFRAVLRQRYDYSCGSAAVATLLRYHYGRDVGEAQVFRAMYAAGDQAKIQKVGFSLLDMKTYLANQGFKPDGYRLGYDELLKIQAPSIAVISIGPYKHFVVIKGVRPGEVLVGDPASGVKIYSRGDFEKVWGHIVFMIHDEGGARGAFNRPEEWRFRAPPPMATALTPPELDLVVETPPLFQVTQLGATR